MEKNFSFILLFCALVGFPFQILIAQTPCVLGMAGAYPCNNVDLQAHLPLSSMGGSTGANDIWGWTDPLSGDEYALVGLRSGTAFVDITVPTAPVYLGSLPNHIGTSSWKDIKVYNNHAFIVRENLAGLQIFDLTQLRTVVSPPVAFTETAYTEVYGTGGAHNLVMNETTGYLYAVGADMCSNGPIFLNVSNPLVPVLEGCFSGDGYTHDAMCFIYNGPDLEHVGKEICIASNTDTQTIIDVTDKANPSQISRTTYSLTGYTHQGWVSQDHKYLYFNDELDETTHGINTTTIIWNIEDLDSPFEESRFVNTTPAIDHNLYINGNYVFEANYRAGLRILEMDTIVPTGEQTLNEVGYFDTYPANDNPNFNGAWSNYPYFASGNIVINDISSGLFIVKPNLPYFAMKGNDSTLQVCSGNDAVFTIDFSQYNGFSDNITSFNISGAPVGTTITPSLSPPFASNASMTITVSNTALATAGNYSLFLEAETLTEKHDISVGMTIYEAPAATTLALPADGTIGLGSPIVLIWTATAGAVTYDLDIATDNAFTSIVQSVSGITGTSYPVSGLSISTQYFWRVRGVNTCFVGSFAPTFDFTTATILPVSLLEWNARVIDEHIQLRWLATDEIDLAGFEIQRKQSHTAFETMAWIEGAGTTGNQGIYLYNDETTLPNTDFFYRLKMINDDGTFEYSAIVFARINQVLVNTIGIHPNPIQDVLKLQVTSFVSDLSVAEIYSMDGRQVSKHHFDVRSGTNEFRMEVNQLQPGIYMLKYTGTHFQKSIRFVKR